MEIKKLFQENHVVYSYEIFPPKVDSPLKESMIRSEVGRYATGLYQRNVRCRRKRTKQPDYPVDGAHPERYGVESLAHLTCIGATKQHRPDARRTAGALRAKRACVEG